MNPLSWLVRRRAIDRDLDAEIRNHFRMAIQERIEAGEDPESARLAAIHEFGNVLQAKEDARAVWRGGAVAMVTDVWQDVGSHPHADQEPGFSLVVLAVLTLGIAGNAAIFSLFKGLALSRCRACASRLRSPSCSAAPAAAATWACRIGLSLL